MISLLAVARSVAFAGDPIRVILVLAILGVCLYLLFRFVPMDPIFQTLIKVVVVILAIVWLLRLFGLI